MTLASCHVNVFFFFLGFTVSSQVSEPGPTSNY